MEKAVQQAVGGSAPVPVNQQQGAEQDTGLSPSRVYDLNDIAFSLNDALDASMPLDLSYPYFGQFPVAALPLNPAPTGFEQFPITSLPANRVFSGWEAAPHANLSPSLTYTDTEWFPTAGLPMASIGFVHPPSPAHTYVEQSLCANLPSSPACDQNHAVLSGSNEAPGTCSSSNLIYVTHPQSNEFSLPQRLSENDALFGGLNQAMIVHRDCPYPASDDTFAQNISPWQYQSNTYQSGLYDDSNHLPSSLEQTHSADGAPAISTSQVRRCIRCWKAKKKCLRTSKESRCLECVNHNIPASVCSQGYDIRRIKPFSKCSKIKHKSLFKCVQSSVLSPPKTVRLGHYPNGPSLDVECVEFPVTDETDKTQISVVRKNLFGCDWMRTTAYRIANLDIDISSYLQECVGFFIDEACRRHRYPTSFFFNQARVYEDELVIQQVFTLHAALRCLRVQWKFYGDESLGMSTVNSKGSIFHGFKCVPRMVLNQLNYAVELEMMRLDKKILDGIWNIMNRERRKWPIGFLALVLLLHIREVDAGRLIYWSRFYTELSDFWIYSSEPTALIDETIASCNSILSHFHYLWRQPLHLNWDEQKSKDMVDNDPKIVKTMKALQKYASELRNNGLIGRKACNLYKAGNPNSVDFTIVSLLFESVREGCEVKDFC